MKVLKIAIIHSGKAYLPEVQVYRDYFGKHGFEVNILSNPTQKSLHGYNIEWHLMGLDFLPKIAERLKIHEYTSLPVPPYAKLKNYLKRQINTKPDLRIFLDDAIKGDLGFKDNIPYRIRNSGIGKHFFNIASFDEGFDFVYIGSTDQNRQLNILFNKFIERFEKYSLLVVGKPSKNLRPAKNIHFSGNIAYEEVPDYARQAKYGLNYIPLKYPFHLQPSYKLLEYCALNLKIITTDYYWVNKFEQSREGNFFKIKPDWSNFYPEMIADFDYRTPDVSDLQWETILGQSGILNFIQEHFESI